METTSAMMDNSNDASLSQKKGNDTSSANSPSTTHPHLSLKCGTRKASHGGLHPIPSISYSRPSATEMASTQFTDYYSLLEIAVESDAKTINKAYRKKALQYHPDKNKGDAKASGQSYSANDK